MTFFKTTSTVLQTLLLIWVAEFDSLAKFGVSSFSISTTISSASSLSFSEMKGLEDRLKALEQSAPSSLISFYERHLNSFSVKPGASRLSVTSTCCALNAILATQDKSLYSSFIQLDTSVGKVDSKDQRIPAQSFIKNLLSSQWRENDLFQIPLLLATILAVDEKRSIIGCGDTMDETMSRNLSKLVQGVLNARPKRRFGNQQIYSDYILFQCAVCYLALDKASPCIPNHIWESIDDQDIPRNATTLLSVAVSRCAEISKNELCRQLALRASGDTTLFDVMRLVYSMLTYVISTQALEGSLGRAIVEAEGLNVNAKIIPANNFIVEAALKAFFEDQNEDGMWDKGQPIYKAFQRTGRNVGNAFIFGVDPLASLLHYLPASYFRPYLKNLEKSLRWIEINRKVEILPVYCDPMTQECTGRSLTGWTSPHLTAEVGPEAWSTAQTINCISRMLTLVQSVTNLDVLAEFRGQQLSKNGVDRGAWDRLLDSDLGSIGSKQPRTLKDVIDERIITPRLDPSRASLGPSYSAILFGPPGTAKTTICESLAKRIGWDFLVIDTSEFLADGLTNVASRIRYVFARLQSLKNCVILFDEIEEFCLDRETPGLGMESRMLTTAMLTAINDLRRKQQSIFFLATNRLRAFDAAITRPGRFDMQLFVGTPNLNARIEQLRQKLADVPVDKSKKVAAMEAYRSFLESVWMDDARFMNYLEGMQFASACASLVQRGFELTDQELQSILDAQTAVMTVRGQVRDEFLASMGLTRL